MLMVTITAIVAFFITSLTDFFGGDRLKKRPKLKASIVGMIALLSVYAGYSLDIIGVAQNKPKIEVKTSIRQDKLSISVVGDKPNIEKILINFHLPYHISNVERLGSSKSAIYAEGNQTPDYLTNRLQIRIEDIPPKKQLLFNAFLSPSAMPNIKFIDRNIYSVEYIWRYKGEAHYETEWRSLIDDSHMSAPMAELSAIRMVGGATEGTLWVYVKPKRQLTANESTNLISLDFKRDKSPADKGAYKAPDEPIPRKEF